MTDKVEPLSAEDRKWLDEWLFGLGLCSDERGIAAGLIRRELAALEGEVIGYYLCSCGSENAATLRNGVRESLCTNCGKRWLLNPQPALEGDAWRAGWEACREAAAKECERVSEEEESANENGYLCAEDWCAAAIRALPTPAAAEEGRELTAGEQEVMARALRKSGRPVAPNWQDRALAAEAKLAAVEEQLERERGAHEGTAASALRYSEIWLAEFHKREAAEGMVRAAEQESARLREAAKCIAGFRYLGEVLERHGRGVAAALLVKTIDQIGAALQQKEGRSGPPRPSKLPDHTPIA